MTWRPLSVRRPSVRLSVRKQLDMSTCARRFLRNYQAESNDMIHNTSTLVVVGVHCAKFMV